ncbi:MAG: carboxypeptidase-like regulatory domain-containing protein [Bacteroidota bacterium]|nr:carboxypeptidase-like regulatory domain-containing protein [Bacteroidota bacterium]
MVRIKEIVLFFFVPFLFYPVASACQNTDKELVQFSGITITADSLNPVPFTKINIKGTHKAVTSDLTGYFSFVAHKKDTILFLAIGFKPASFIIPDTITKNRYSLIQMMTADTITLTPAIILPWPTLEEFKQAFINTKIPEDDLARARKNLDINAIRIQAENTPWDGPTNYANYIENQTSKLYYYGQQQPFQILNPFAWAQFIKAWKEGKFKRKQSTTNE